MFNGSATFDATEPTFTIAPRMGGPSSVMGAGSFFNIAAISSRIHIKTPRVLMLLIRSHVSKVVSGAFVRDASTTYVVLSAQEESYNARIVLTPATFAA